MKLLRIRLKADKFSAFQKVSARKFQIERTKIIEFNVFFS